MNDGHKKRKPISPSAMFKKVEQLGQDAERRRADLLAITPHKKRTELLPEKAIYPRRKKIFTRRDTILDTGCEDDCPACAIEKDSGVMMFKLGDLQRRTALEVARSTLKNQQKSLPVARKKSAEKRAKITPEKYRAAMEAAHQNAKLKNQKKIYKQWVAVELGVSRETLRLYESKLRK